MEFTNELEQDLNTLIQEHGLIALLEALQEVIEIKVEGLISTSPESTESNDDHTAALQAVSHLLGQLIATVPPELEVELALAQVMHPSADLEPDGEKLASGLE